MIILPTMGRPANLARFFKAYHDTGATLPVYAVFDKGDPTLSEYAKLDFPANSKKIGVPPGTRLGEIFNAVFHVHPDDDYYATMADDVVPETEHWDVKLRDACLPGKISWGTDKIKNSQLCTHPFIGGDLLRKLGWMACPGVNHWYIDNMWKLLADTLHIGVYMPEVITAHRHFSQGYAPSDKVYENQPNHKRDKRAFQKYCREELPALLERIAA